VSVRRTGTRNVQRGSGLQTLTNLGQTGVSKPGTTTGVAAPVRNGLQGQTVGLTMTYVPARWWSLEAAVGQDGEDTETHRFGPGYTTPTDTAYAFSQTQNERRSQRVATTVQVPIGALAQGTIAMGSDGWQSLLSSSGVTAPSVFSAATTSASRTASHNAGAFIQSQLGLWDRLFLMYGLRAEWNPNFGAEETPTYAPRYGIAATNSAGPLTVKLRASYGRSTRPPAAGLKSEKLAIQALGATDPRLPYWGTDFPFYLANPELAPEHQKGGEGGIELYWGSRASLVVTRFNQTVDGLISQVSGLDSTRSLVPCQTDDICTAFGKSADADGYVYLHLAKYLNLASIRNQGWELQGSTVLGAVTARAIYSWTKSRTMGVDPRYRPFIPVGTFGFEQFQQGAAFNYLPEHTWMVGMTYSTVRSTVDVTVNGNGQVPGVGGIGVYAIEHFNNFTIRLPHELYNYNGAGSAGPGRPYATADINATHRFTPSVESVLQIRNVGNFYANDLDTRYATMGRQTKAGVRIRM
jgi:hypothetical protein